MPGIQAAHCPTRGGACLCGQRVGVDVFFAGPWLCRPVHQMQPCASSDVKPGCETTTRMVKPQPRSTSNRRAPVSAPTRSITREPNPGVTTVLALRGAGIGAVIADQQVHCLLGDAVD